MKYINTFENLMDVAYSVGDIVVCVADAFDKVGSKYKVNRIYTGGVSSFHPSSPISNLDYVTRFNLGKDILVEVEELATGSIYKNIWSNRFISETEYNLRKYNI